MGASRRANHAPPVVVHDKPALGARKRVPVNYGDSGADAHRVAVLAAGALAALPGELPKAPAALGGGGTTHNYPPSRR